MPDWERKYMGRWKMPNDDYILRSDAVFAFCGACEGTEICGQMGEPCDEVKRIRAIPAADVEPVRHGRWINDSDNIPHCSECEAIALQRHKLYLSERIFEVPFVLSKRCPECGAKMLPEPPKEEDNAEGH